MRKRGFISVIMRSGGKYLRQGPSPAENPGLQLRPSNRRGCARNILSFCQKRAREVVLCISAWETISDIDPAIRIEFPEVNGCALLRAGEI